LDASVSETVTVLGTAALLDTTSPSIGTVIRSAQLEALPLAGRHWAGLISHLAQSIRVTVPI